MRKSPSLLVSLVALPLLSFSAHAAETKKTIEGNVPADGLDHFFVPFDVPTGTQEIEIHHEDQSDANILDFGLYDTKGHRGWGGGTSENTIVNAGAASRGYVAGPIEGGTWKVVVGKAKIVEMPGKYKLDITFRDTVTLAAQTRKPYAEVPAIRTGRKYYSIDFHVHSQESTDASPSLDQIAKYAVTQGLDAVVVSDHNVTSQLDYFADAQAANPSVLLVPGVEYTTYAGHALGIGATKWVDHKVGQPGVTIEGAATAFRDMGALFALAHPALDIGNACIGCGWKHTLKPELIGGVEICTGSIQKEGASFTNAAIDFWQNLVVKGAHIPAIGGSDDHGGGNNSLAKSNIGEPTTYILADELSVPALLKGLREGRTFVKLRSAKDPAVELDASVAPTKDTIETTAPAVLKFAVKGLAEPMKLRLVKNGATLREQDLTADQVVEESVNAPELEEDSYRAELRAGTELRVVTSHLFVKKPGAVTTPTTTPPVVTESGGCSLSPSSTSLSVAGFGSIMIALAAMASRLRRRG
ncbi:MAG: PHP domain-containing protein [Polyangiaceae bacterium]|nr:PHP domain-containing protein [Polyangiaceae bacterium]